MTVASATQVPTPAASEPSRLLRGLRADGHALTRAEHQQVHGSLTVAHRSADESIVALASASGLRGRGGGGFPLASKLQAVRAASGRMRRPVVVVNGAESEPGSRKDAVLLARSPHLVLDGAELVAVAVGAREITIWLHRGARVQSRVLEVAIAERASHPMTKVRYHVVEGPARYVAGEASALAAHLSGGEAKPTMTPPRVAERGVADRPTLVSNAETLAHLALVARHGAQWFRSLGTPDEPGTMLFTVIGAVAVPGVVEGAVGSSFGQIVAAAGGVTSRPSALLVGGYAGSWLTPEVADPLPYSAKALNQVGAVTGVGLVAVLPEDACPVVETARLSAWLSSESAGQCGPCVRGLPALAGAAQSLSIGRGPQASAAVNQLARWAAMVDGRGACHHPDGVAQLVQSLLRSFPDEVARHAAGYSCPGVVTPSILPLPVPERGGLAWR